MKTPAKSSIRRGFTLMELMVAMAITTIIVTVLVSITSIALDTWNRSRSELRASRQAKSMIDTIARDFESMVIRRGNQNEWLSTIELQRDTGDQLETPNVQSIIFFTAATDRYNGQIGSATADKGGDVSCVIYSLAWRDPLAQNSQRFKTFVLNRMLVDPDRTFTDLLGKPDLSTAFNNSPLKANVDSPADFVCENIYQFTLTFHIEVAVSGTSPQSFITVPISIREGGSGNLTTDSFKITGSGNVVEKALAGYSIEQIKAGRLKAVGIGLTILTDTGIDQLRNRTIQGNEQAEFLAKNSYQYSKLVQLPGM